jgi:5-histidylcysteine sulfoxide synthase/putative 4-mercaptohistidine N1-methyltranferase
MTSAPQTRNPNLDSNIRTQMAGAHSSLSSAALKGAEEELSVLRKNWWTGVEPSRCQGIDTNDVLHSLTPPDQSTCTREQVKAYFDNTWTLTETLFLALTHAEGFYVPPYHNLRHPLIFYYTHPAALYVNKLRVAGLLDASVNAYFEQLFETGVDEMSWDDLSKNEMEWPRLSEAHAYRKEVYRLVTKLIETHPGLAPGHAPITMDHPLWALFLGFDHERIHLETTSVLMRELPVDLVRRPKEFPALHPSTATPSAFPPKAGRDYPSNALAVIEAGHVRLGKDRAWPTFGWDNEYGTKELETPAFESSRFLVSNGEFWEFVSDGGYRDETLWTTLGWQWRQFRNVKWPTFWVPDGPQGSFRFKLRTCFEVIDMPWSWPAAVNYHEAKAYAAWRSRKDGKSYRLPTEAEHYRLRAVVEPDRALPSYAQWYGAGSLSPSKHVALSNFDLKWGSESPVDEQLAHEPSLQVCDVFGNLWQWLEDDFHPLAGFKVHPYYDDFSTPCFDGRHTMMVGGSFISTGDESSYYERFHFRPHFYQHSGFRLVSGAPGSLEKLAGRIASEEATGSAVELRRVVDEQLNLHYGSLENALPRSLVQMPGGERLARFPEELANLTVAWTKKLKLPTTKALEVGCSVGGGVFRLSDTFERVIGTDLSAAFILTAQELKQKGAVSYMLQEEGDLTSPAIARVPAHAQPLRAEFRQADASSLPAEYVDFDAVVISNVLDRLPSPKSLLARMSGPRGIVKRGGLLVIASSFDWNERFTPKELWLGGVRKGDKAQSSAEGLSEVMSADFELLETKELPLMIRQSRVRFAFMETQVTVWRRK